jgi:hypothetical protein
MHVWLDLISRELLFFALLTALGSGPASFLPARFGNTVRFALAPAFGLCVGVCLTVTLVYAFPASETGWVVIAFAAASVALGSWRGHTVRWPRVVNLAQVLAVVIVVIGSFNFAFGERGTVGPAGGYQVGDASGYVSETNGEARESIHQIDRVPAPFADLSLGYWAVYAKNYQQLDVSALEATVNELLGLGSTETMSPFLIAVILAGALGVFATVRTITGRPTWAAVLAAVLLAGPLFTQLFMDGSQAALTGSSLIGPLVVVGLEALSRRRLATLVLFALLAAGLETIYPLFVPPVAIGGVASLLFVAGRRMRRGRPAKDELFIAAGQVVGVLALAAAFTPVAFARDVRYWISILKGSLPLAALPGYKLPVSALPGWVLQTRDFYRLIGLRHASASELFMGAFVPLLLIALIAYGIWRHRSALLVLAVALGASLLAYYTSAGEHCGYCVQRNLIPVGVLAPIAVGLGVAALAALRSRIGVMLVAGAVAIIAITIGNEAIVEHQRLANGSYLLDHQDRQALAARPANSGPLELEGFSEGQQPPMEQALIYDLADEQTDHDVSLPTLTDDGSSLAYLLGPEPLGPSFKSNYQYVLTRLGAVATPRRVVARFGPIVLEQRVRDLDVTITGGVSVAPARIDPAGVAWVSGPMEFLVVGGQPGGQAWISLSLRRTVPVGVNTGALPSTVHRRGDLLRICLKAAGSAPVRSAGLQLAFTSQPAPPPSQSYADPLPPRGVRLVSMSASSKPCDGRKPRSA